MIKRAIWSKLLKAIGDFERIADHSVNVLESIEELREKKIIFSDGAKQELNMLCAALSEILHKTLKAFTENDLTLAVEVEPLEQVIDRLKTKLRDSHIVRLRNGDCTVEAGFIWSDLLTNMERTADHCSNLAVCLIDAQAQNLNLHESLHQLRRGNPAYDDLYRRYAEQYLN